MVGPMVIAISSGIFQDDCPSNSVTIPSGMNCRYWRQFAVVIVVPSGIDGAAATAACPPLAPDDAFTAGGIAGNVVSLVAAAKPDGPASAPNPITTSDAKNGRANDLIVFFAELGLLEDFLGDRRRRHRGRPSRIEGQMRDEFAELVLGNAVAQRAFEMTPQLIGPLQRDERRAGYQAAVALGELGTFPDVAEKHLFSEINQLRHDRA